MARDMNKYIAIYEGSGSSCYRVALKNIYAKFNCIVSDPSDDTPEAALHRQHKWLKDQISSLEKMMGVSGLIPKVSNSNVATASVVASSSTRIIKA